MCVCVALNPECASVLPHSGLRMCITAGPSIRRLVSPSVIHPSRMVPVLALSTASAYGALDWQYRDYGVGLISEELRGELPAYHRLASRNEPF